jgi:hypothetical protein
MQASESLEVGVKGSDAPDGAAQRRKLLSRRLCAVAAFVSVCAIAVGLGVGLRNAAQASTSPSSASGQATASSAFNMASTMKSRTYKYLSYDQIVQRLRSLQATYPNLAEVFTAQDRYSLPSAGNCVIEGISQPCKASILP